MQKAVLRMVSFGIGFALGLGALTTAWAQPSVTTWHYDNSRSGANTSETMLTPQNVNPQQFGKLFTQAVDGQVVAQALYLPQLTIPGAGVHNVVFVATMHDSVYAFDADSASGVDAAPLWHTSFLVNGATTVPMNLQGCGGVTFWTEVGIVSTPVIDPTAGLLYVLAKTYENSNFVHRLHALSVTTGEEAQGFPIVITASYTYNGKTYEMSNHWQVNRPALLLDNGYIYIPFGSNGCRSGKEEGWVVAYNASTQQQAGVFDLEPGESAAAVWMRGGGLSADSEGNVYGATADGPFAAGTNFGQSVFKLTEANGTLELADWFTPYNELILDHQDLDLSEPVLMLPTQGGPYPNLAVAVGKEGTIYLLNRNNLGHFCDTCTKGDTQIVQELQGFAPEPGAFVYWNNALYTTGTGQAIMGLTVSNGVIVPTPFAQSKKVDSGHSPVLSANGSSDGILWQLTGGALSAFNATTLARLYSDGQAAKDRDVLPPLSHFANVVEVNGKVYVGTKNSLVAFGLLN
jgi:hypothetical protein